MLEKFIDVLIMVSIDLEIGLHNYQHTFQRYRIVIINTDNSESIILDVIMFIFFYYSILHVPYFSIVYTQYDILVSRT